MRIISFAWTSPALLAGAKTVTRRDWDDSYARRFSAGELVAAVFGLQIGKTSDRWGIMSAYKQMTPAVLATPRSMPTKGLASMDPKYTPEFITRFWQRLDRSGDCWEWTGARNKKSGYGQLKYRGVGLLAHRTAYELAKGPIPDGLWVRHDCDNPPCCNPDHLRLGTHGDNMKDMVKRGRHSSILSPERMPRGERHGLVKNPERAARGEQHGSAKLTDDIVREIRASHAAGASINSLARKYGVNKRGIQFIVRRKTWRHVDA